MAFEHTAVFARPVEEVFDWHARPGALTRLLPPWQPVRVEREAESLESGRVVLAGPGGVRWVAAHQRDGFERHHRFTDVLDTPLLRSVVRWRHSHVFSAEPTGGTRLVDRVETAVPERWLEEMFGYRTRQLRADLAAHSRWPAPGKELTVAVTGSGGLIGSAVTALLSTGGHRVIRLVRSRPAGDDRLWQPHRPDPGLLDGVDAVVHLAGEPLAGRFTAGHKEAVRDSRIEPTRRLAELAGRAGVKVMASASAIGIYGSDRGDENLTEDSPRGGGFLADLVADWEAATEPARRAGVRVVTVRTGIVQSPRGGMLKLLRPVFEAGLGGRLGDGRQWMAWIGIDDIAEVYLRAVLDHTLEGPVNAVAPTPERNGEYTRVLAAVLRRPALIPVPPFGPRLLLGGEGAREVAAASQRVVPARLLAGGHEFRHPSLEAALRHVLGRARGRTLA